MDNSSIRGDKNYLIFKFYNFTLVLFGVICYCQILYNFQCGVFGVIVDFCLKTGIMIVHKSSYTF